jgi:hypothetical protein
LEKKEAEYRVKSLVKNNSIVKSAKRDYLAGSLLLKKENGNDVCNTIFHFQQSIEKLTKFFFILMTLSVTRHFNPNATEKDKNELIRKQMMTIRHDHRKLIGEMIGYANRLNIGSGYSLGILKILGLQSGEIKEEDMKKALEEDNKMLIARLPKKKLLHLIAYADNFSFDMVGVDKKKLNLSDVLLNPSKGQGAELQSVIEKGRAELEETAEEKGLTADEYFNAVASGIWPLMSQLPRLLMYGLILFVHEKSTRYYDEPLTPDDYIRHNIGISNRRVLEGLDTGIGLIFDEIDSSDATI